MRRDFFRRQMQLVVQIGLSDWGQFINARHGKRAHHQRMFRRQRRQMPASRPAGSHHLARYAMRLAMRAEPIQRGVNLRHNLVHGSIGGEGIAANPNRPASGQGAFGHDGEILSPIALPIAAMDEDQAGRISARCGVKVPFLPLTRAEGQIEMPGMRGAKRD